MRECHPSLHGPLAAAALLAFVTACAGDQPATAPVANVSAAVAVVPAVVGGPPQYVAGEMIVKFKAGATTARRGTLMRAAKAARKEKIVTEAMRGRGDNEGIEVLSTSMSVPEAVAAIRGNADVEYAEPNWIYHTEATANDPYVTNGSLWGMTGTYGSQASVAWANNKTDCSSVYIGIIDEGFMFTHEDLLGSAATNPFETANGRDDDGNGFIDDIRGWDFDGNNASTFDGVGDDHGTHVAGTIGGNGGNGKGVAGVCWSVKLLNAKFLGSQGGTTANAVKAVDYFTNLKLLHPTMNIVATSNSWGGGGFSQALGDAIARANAQNILFIAAAGNSSLNCEVSDCYPAEYPNANVIAVASITSTGALSSFSNYGATTIDIGAPGSGINSSVPTGTKRTVTSGYANYSGTSMATPHVSGAAALYAAQHPGSTAAQIKAAILNSATATGSLAGKTVTGGRLNVSGF